MGLSTDEEYVTDGLTTLLVPAAMASLMAGYLRTPSGRARDEQYGCGHRAV